MDGVKKGMITHRKNVGIHCGGGGVVAMVAGVVVGGCGEESK